MLMDTQLSGQWSPDEIAFCPMVKVVYDRFCFLNWQAGTNGEFIWADRSNLLGQQTKAGKLLDLVKTDVSKSVVPTKELPLRIS